MQPLRSWNRHAHSGVLSLPYHSPVPFDVQIVGDTAVLALRGYVTGDSRAMLMEQATRALAQYPCLIMNLAGVEFIDSFTLATLVDLANRARNQQRVMSLAAVPVLMIQMLFISRLDLFFDIYEDVEAALDAWQIHTHALPPPSGGAPDWLVVKMPRSLDAGTMPALVERCIQSLKTNVKIILDFSETAFLSNSGRASMLKLKRVLQESEGRLRFVGCSTEILRAFQLMALPGHALL